MPVTEIGDPRLQALFGARDANSADVRPAVRLPRTGLPPVAVAIVFAVAAVLLFVALNARRTSQVEPAVRSRASEGTGWAPPPPLYIPPAPAPVIVQPVVEARPAAPLPVPAHAPVRTVTAPQVVYTPQPIPQLAPETAAPPPARASSGAALVIDGSSAAPAEAQAPSPAGPDTAGMAVAGRMRASALANRSMTVPQGHLIPAVLETGFDSTRPGFARAIVSRDVRGFDGQSILIPRGSRLVGSYKAAVAQGQKRAVISWTRLIRPDGMTIAMDAPAVDPLGRGGIPAKVNSHFFARLGDALLQTTMDLGRTVAGRSVTGPVVVLPGAVGSTGTTVASGTVREPTLTIAPGKSINVFVAHDLDFSAAGAAR